MKAYNFKGRLHNNKKTSYKRRTSNGKSDERFTLGDQQQGECKAYALPGQGERTSNKTAIKRRTAIEARHDQWGGGSLTLSLMLQCI